MLPGRNLYLWNHIRSTEDGKMSTTLQNKEQTIDTCNNMDRLKIMTHWKNAQKKENIVFDPNYIKF